MDGYRDERGAALARLDQLEAERRDRLLASAPERRTQLEAERSALVHRAAGVTRSGLLVVSGVLVALVLLLNAGTGAILGTAFTGPVAGLAMTVVLLAGDLRERRERARRIAAVDLALSSLESPRARVAPAELEEIHLRIAALEADGTAEAGEGEPEMPAVSVARR